MTRPTSTPHNCCRSAPAEAAEHRPLADRPSGARGQCACGRPSVDRTASIGLWNCPCLNVWSLISPSQPADRTRRSRHRRRTRPRPHAAMVIWGPFEDDRVRRLGPPQPGRLSLFRLDLRCQTVAQSDGINRYVGSSCRLLSVPGRRRATTMFPVDACRVAQVDRTRAITSARGIGFGEMTDHQRLSPPWHFSVPRSVATRACSSLIDVMRTSTIRWAS